ncbi:MAG: integrase domain-containing protein [Betaproteobacteria bacterium]|nr:integrase domain-containing protein [Betaproteobacteria bacterium]
MSKLSKDLKTMCIRNADGSHATQAARFLTLQQCAQQLRASGFNQMRAGNLKMKHVMCLVSQWHKAGLSAGTVKNRMAHVRWMAEKLGKAGMIPKDNAQLGIAERQYAGAANKAQALDGRLELVTDAHVQMSLRLQAAFGLRREESIKVKPCIADHGQVLALQASWCKGGREREIPVQTPEQRAALDAAHALAGQGSLIPAGKSYVQQQRKYDAQCKAAGLSNMHGLRHQYAQGRYEALTGWKCPKAGGSARNTLRGAKREIDRQARMTISAELGHSRRSIVTIYIG